jgi:hypothetical protein
MAQGMIAAMGRSVMLRSALWPDFEAPYTGLWAALALSIPVDGETGDDLVEPSSSQGYTRQYVPLGSENWVPRNETTLVYINSIVWPQPTGPWGRPVAWALLSNSTGGQLFAFGASDVGDVNAASTPPEIDAGGLVVRLTRTTL